MGLRSLLRQHGLCIHCAIGFTDISVLPSHHPFWDNITVGLFLSQQMGSTQAARVWGELTLIQQNLIDR